MEAQRLVQPRFPWPRAPLLGDTGGGEVGALLTAARERCDEAPFARAEWAASETGDVPLTFDRRAAGRTKALKLTAFHSFSDGDHQAVGARLAAYHDVADVT